MTYFYGMRLRGYSIGCQPNGCCCRTDDPDKKYHDIIGYKRELTHEEMSKFDLDYIGESENRWTFAERDVK